MISEITGEVLYDRIQRTAILLRAGAICYEVFVPSGIAARLRRAAESERKNPLTIYTLEYIEGGIGGGHMTPRLIGFLEPLDREFFEAFTTVPRVGFMRALKCLVRPVNEIAQAIERGDALFLKQLPFIGAKTAELIVTELRGKMAKFALAPSEEPLSLAKEAPGDLKREAVQALEQLGYSRAEAERSTEAVLLRYKDLKTAEDLLRKLFEQSRPA